MILTLPYPPSNNRYYRHVHGKVLLSAQGRAYRLETLARRPHSGWPLIGRLKLTLEVYPARGKGQDLDNIPKAICDALQFSGIFNNDQQIDDLHVIRREKDASPRVMVTLEELD